MTSFARRRFLACIGLAATGATLHPERALANLARRDVNCQIPTIRLNGEGYFAEFGARVRNEGDRVEAAGTISIPVAYLTKDTPNNATAIRAAESRVMLRVRLAYSSARPDLRVDRYELGLNGPGYLYGLDIRPIYSLLVGDDHVSPTFRPEGASPSTQSAWSAFLNGKECTVWIEDTERQLDRALTDGRSEPYAYLFVQNRLDIRAAIRDLMPRFAEMIERHATLAQSVGTTTPGAELGQDCRIPSAGAPCFFTTATCGAVGLPDECFELRTLRQFRDMNLMRSADGRALVAEYYRIAPALVAAIDARADARRVWIGLYRAYVLPVAVLARLGLSRLAVAHYARLVRRVRALALP